MRSEGHSRRGSMRLLHTRHILHAAGALCQLMPVPRARVGTQKDVDGVTSKKRSWDSREQQGSSSEH